MLSPGYLLRVVRGMSLDKYKEVLDRTAKFSGMSKAAIAADMAKCAVKFGAGYYDYVTFGFWDLTDEQRDSIAAAEQLQDSLDNVTDSAQNDPHKRERHQHERRRA